MTNERAREVISINKALCCKFWDEFQIESYEAFGMALDALAEQEERRWIPVSDRVPEDDRLVIVCTESGQVYTDYYFDDKPDFWEMAKIIAWQDLPKAYKKEDTNGES